MRIVDIPINQLKRDSKQPRHTFDTEKIKGMAQSILTEGIINPIEVDEHNVIVTGEMRWRAAKQAGLKTVPCKVIKITPENRFRRQFIENFHHNTMTEWDTAKALEKLASWVAATHAKDKFNPKTDKGYRYLAKIIGTSHRTIGRYLQLLTAPKSAQVAIQNNELSVEGYDVIQRAPVEYQEELIRQAPVLKRDGLREKVSALKRNPEKADEILNARPSQVTEIAPRIADQIRESYNPVNELSDIIDSLVAWLTNNPASSVGSIHAPRIILNLSGAIDSINEWSRNINQASLKGTSDEYSSSRQN